MYIINGQVQSLWKICILNKQNSCFHVKIFSVHQKIVHNVKKLRITYLLPGKVKIYLY